MLLFSFFSFFFKAVINQPRVLVKWKRVMTHKRKRREQVSVQRKKPKLQHRMMDPRHRPVESGMYQADPLPYESEYMVANFSFHFV